EPVGVARAVALDQAVSLELAQVVAELVQAVGVLREVEGVEDGLMDLPGRPAADLRTAMQEDLEQADDARLVDLEAGITHRADRDRIGEALQQREIDMHVEPLGLQAGEAIRDRLEGGPHGIEMVEPLAQAEVGEIVGDQFVAQKGPQLLILFEEAALEVGAEDMMAGSMTVASLPCIRRLTRLPKIVAILSELSRHRPSSQLRSNSLWMGKRRLKMKLRQYSIWEMA